MATSWREAVRNGIAQASRLHEQLNTRATLGILPGAIDVFEVIARLNVPLLIRPLDGLLGAYIPTPSPGILVTTKRRLSVQRFTAAHELAHHILNHKTSLDDENVIRRSPFAHNNTDLQEVEANVFAAAFLMPPWLIMNLCEKQGWAASDLESPHTTYQLSLRLGVSFPAACFTLQQYKLLSPDVVDHLLKSKRKTLKQDLLNEFEPENYYGDVWLLSEADIGAEISGSRNDLFVVRLKEHSHGGYLWNFDQLTESGFVIVQDTTEGLDDKGIGSPSWRIVTAKIPAARSGRLIVTESRPWAPRATIADFAITYDLTGPEYEGYSRAERRRQLEAA